MSSLYRPSNYNHAIKHENKWLIFNGVSSALVMLDDSSYVRLQPYLFGPRREKACLGVPKRDEPERPKFRPPLNSGNYRPFRVDSELDPSLRETLERFIEGQYIVEDGFDELDYLRQRYRTRQHDDPLLVTVVTTMDCNLGCYYCYEDKYPSAMSDETCDRIYDHIVADLSSRNQKRMHLGWFGGEPMLNKDAIEYLSKKLLAYCSANKVQCTISMVSNGTVWPADPVAAREFVIRNQIGSIQFSFDGLPANHNNRRHYKGGNRGHEVTSFDALVRTIDAIRGYARLYLRLNLDDGNKEDAYELVEFFHSRGWFAPGSKIYPYLAALGPYTDTCHSVERNAVDFTEFDLMDNEFRRYMSQYIDIREFVYANYPRALPLNCSAVAEHSVIFGPEGEMYKCTHDLGIKTKSYGHVAKGKGNDTASLFPILNSRPKFDHKAAAPNDYPSFDPFASETCSECRYLPNCLGGCPKVQFEKQEYYLGSTCATWENSFEPMVRNFAETLLRGSSRDSVLSEAVQVSVP